MRKILKQFSLIEKISITSFFLFTAIIYFHNVTRDVYSGDIGDLVTAAYVFGVAHPPGYPLFTLFGFIFSHLPLPVPVVTKVGYVSAIFSLLSLVVFFMYAFRVVKNTFLSLLTTAILAFSYLFWLHAEVPEVFGLNNFFVILILYLAILFYQTKKLLYLYLLGFATGLSLTHHQTILFVLPGALLLVLRHAKLFWKDKKIIPLGILFLFAGLIPYIYVPIAASGNPVVNWDHATTFDNFIRLLLRLDYGGFAPPIVGGEVPPQIKLLVVKNYFTTLFDNFSYQVIFLAIIGVIYLIKNNRYLGIALLVSFFLTGPAFIYYSATPVATSAAFGIIERFYVFSSVVLMFFVPFGFVTLRQYLEKLFSRKLYATAVLAYFAVVPIMMLWYNFPKTDLSKTNIGNNLAEDILATVPQNGLLFVKGDTTTFNLWYVHYILGERPDIGLINPPKIAGSNYLDAELTKYKKKHPNTKTGDVFSLTLRDLHRSRAIHATSEDVAYQPQGLLFVPMGLSFRILDPSEVPPKDIYSEQIESNLKKMRIARRETLHLRDSNMIASEIPLIYSNALVRIGDFMTSQYKDYGAAEHYYRRALWIDATNPAGWSGLSLSQFNGRRDCKSAISNMQRAIEEYIVWKNYYIKLYALYISCNANKQTIEKFEKDYEAIFNENVDKYLPKNYDSNKPITQ